MARDLQIVQGAAKDFVLQIFQDGIEAGGFLATDLLSVEIWGGQDQPVLFQPAVMWLPPNGYATGQYIVSFQNLDTATWLPAEYSYQVFLERDGRKGEITGGGGTLRVLPSAGSGESKPVYCTLQDMLLYVRWIQTLSVFRTDETGFLAQRHESRQWLENHGQRHYALNSGVNIQTFGNAVPSWGPMKSGTYNVWLQNQFDANYLMISPPRRVKEVTAKYAAFLVLQDVISGAGEKNSWYADKANYLMDDCSNLIKCMTLELDRNGDGYAETTIELSSIPVLRG